jgi:hypothetical protein
MLVNCLFVWVFFYRLIENLSHILRRHLGAKGRATHIACSLIKQEEVIISSSYERLGLTLDEYDKDRVAS